MRVMVIVKANKDSEAGVMPSEKLLAEMGKFNEELANAKILVSGDGLHPTSKAKRVFFGRDKKVVSGPFTEPQLTSGFWIWNVKSMDEAIEWAKKIPFPENEETNVELRPVFAPEDFGAELTPELRAKEEQPRAKLSQQTS